MSEYKFEINIPADDEGFVTFECPYCGNRFKLNVNEFKESSVIGMYCPICGLINEITNFYTSDVIEKAEEIAMNHAIDLINNMFRNLERSTKGSKYLKFKTQNIKKDTGKVLYENVDEFEIVELNNCCNKSIKVTLIDKFIGTYCPYCGRR